MNEALADAQAAALMAAPAAERGAQWEKAEQLPAADLAWALKRACDAAWTADPPKTRLAAELLATLAARQPDPLVGAIAAWALGIGCLSQGQMEAALRALDDAGARFAAIGRWHERAQTQVARVMALAMLGRHDEAIACGAQARAQFDTDGDARAAGKVELNLGNLAARRDQAERATRHFTEARRRFIAAGDVELEVMAVFGLAEIDAQRHEFERAARLYDEARAAAERGGFALDAVERIAAVRAQGHAQQDEPVLRADFLGAVPGQGARFDGDRAAEFVVVVDGHVLLDRIARLVRI